MTQDERKVIELALEALEMIHDENMDYLTRNKLGGENNQCMVFARETITAIKEALAQPETPYKIGQRIAKTGGGISHLWSAVSQDDEIAEAERGFKEALAQPEQREPTKQEHNILMGALKRSGKVVAQPEQEPCEYCKRGLKTMCLCGIKAKPKEPEQEPVAVKRWPSMAFGMESLQDAFERENKISPQRKPLTDEQIKDIRVACGSPLAIHIEFARAIEAAHGIKE